ncbi:MAG: S8 family serine peptidase [Verrucomicrobiaceae bacterium]|nr:S8 family serine peptidase [Verrucomicrobiaceae bacterium]
MKWRLCLVGVLSLAVVVALICLVAVDSLNTASNPLSQTTLSFSGLEKNRPVPLAVARRDAVLPVLPRPFPRDRSKSNDPAERAIASGQVLQERVLTAATVGRWRRERLVRSVVQERLLHVQEEWEDDAAGARWVSYGRNIFLADQVIVRASVGVSRDQLSSRLRDFGMSIVQSIGTDLFTVRLPSSDLDALPAALISLNALHGWVASSEGDGVGFGAGTPNDTSFATQWGHHNTGQSGGTVDADVDAPEFWDILDSTPGIVVAVLDSGLNFTHPDLLSIAWTNPGEIAGDGIDNDSSGRIDDVNGWDFTNGDNNPTDDHGHGSNVSGIIAANRNNATGIAGMIGGAKLLVCKILNASNSGLTSNLIAATTYARLRGAPVMNLSLQSYPFSSTLNTEFTACQTAGILLSICAGNQGVNNDTTPNYPSSYTHTNIISVGNHDRTDARWSGVFNPSNYGVVSVDLFAPGRDIYSPILGTSYSSYTGTSQATPYVTAVAAAIKYLNPSWQATDIKNSILASVVTRPAYSGLCMTGGRLNAVAAVSHAVRQLPLADSDGDSYSNLLEYVTGTRMDSAVSRPEVTATTTGGFFRMGLPLVSRPDASLEVQRSTDLFSWFTTNITDFSAGNAIEGGIPADGTQGRFLRVRVVAAP